MDTATHLRRTVERASAALLALDERTVARRPDERHWSIKEIIGHLVDSASNNHRRFVSAQLRDDLDFEGYEQDAWVTLQRYQDADWRSLVTLWRTFNEHVAHVMSATPEEVRVRPRRRHSLDRIAWRAVPADEPATLEYFMQDYVGHLEHHLRQIAALAPGAAIIP